VAEKHRSLFWSLTGDVNCLGDAITTKTRGGRSDLLDYYYCKSICTQVSSAGYHSAVSTLNGVMIGLIGARVNH